MEEGRGKERGREGAHQKEVIMYHFLSVFAYSFSSTCSRSDCTGFHMLKPRVVRGREGGRKGGERRERGGGWEGMYVFKNVCGEGIDIRLVSMLLLLMIFVSFGEDVGNEGHGSLFIMVTVFRPLSFCPPSFHPLSFSFLLLSGEVGHASERVLCGCHHSPRGESRTAGIEGDVAEIHQTVRTV